MKLRHHKQEAMMKRDVLARVTSVDKCSLFRSSRVYELVL